MDRLTLKYLVLQKILRCSLKRSNFEELDSYILTKSEYLIGMSETHSLHPIGENFKITSKKKNKIINLYLELAKAKKNITTSEEKLEYLKKENELKDLLKNFKKYSDDDHKGISKNYYRVARRILNGQINQTFRTFKKND